MNAILGSFTCSRNLDIETFIKEKASDYDRRHWAKTQLIFHDDFKPFELLAYYSLAFKEVHFSDISKNLEKRIRGGSSSKPKKFPAYLIGQLGKNDSIKNNPVNLQVILDEALTVISASQKYVGGRCVILECCDDEGLINHYIKHEFKVLQKDELVTMYALL